MIKISIDLGHCFSSVGFVHGDKIMALKPKEERDGKRIPTIYYRDKNQSACGTTARRFGRRKPDCMVEYIKKKLEEPKIRLDGTDMEPYEIVKEYLQFLIRGAEQSAREEFFLGKEEIGVVLTVPVIFGEKKKEILKKAVSAVTLEDGRKVTLLKLLTEPEAAAMDNADLQGDGKSSLMIYDLGGGTFDTSLFQLTGDEENPCKFLGLDGRAVGGYDWDMVMLAILTEKLGAVLDVPYAKNPLEKKRDMLLEEARKLKEELSEAETAETSINIQGRYYEVKVTREEFEKRTEKLLQETIDAVTHLARKHKNYPVSHVILVGGGSYMPQVTKAVSAAFPAAKVTLRNPELAIAFGAARYAHTLEEKKVYIKHPQLIKTVKVGIDFGTSFCFVSFVHGNKVMALTPSSDRHGIPSVYYYDGRQELVGKFAESRARKQPENAVRSIKRKLHEKTIRVADRDFTPKEILTKMFAFILDSTEKRLESEFPDVEYDAVEVALSMPVDFTATRIHLVIDALKAVELKSKKKLYVEGVIQEPSAAAVEYFGLTEKKDEDVLVYDLGGGTFDASIVHCKGSDETPYEVIDQEGIRTLGGDDWDKALCDWAIRQLKTQHNVRVTEQQAEELLFIAREVKHELTELEETYFDCAVKGQTFSFPITRQEFEQMTASLLNQTVEKVTSLLKRNSGRNVKYLILTGGSSYMPQVETALREKVVRPYNLEMKLFEPEHAITYGAARFAQSLVWEGEESRTKGIWDTGKDDTEKSSKTGTDKKSSGKTSSTESKKKKRVIDLIAPHGYGIAYVIGGMDGKEMIRLFVKKGDKIPAAGAEISRKRGSNRYISEYRIYETDVCDPSEITKKGGRELVDLEKGRLVMTVNLERTKEVADGCKATQKLSLGDDMSLHFEAFDEVNGARVDWDKEFTMAEIEE